MFGVVASDHNDRDSAAATCRPLPSTVTFVRGPVWVMVRESCLAPLAKRSTVMVSFATVAVSCQPSGERVLR
jgi:hypothetical protein